MNRRYGQAFAESEGLLDRVRGDAGPRMGENTVVPLTRAEFKLLETLWLARMGYF